MFSDFYFKVTKVLQVELNYECEARMDEDRIVLNITNHDFQNNMGALINEIHLIIDKKFPLRKKNLSIAIANEGNLVINVLKIWRSVSSMQEMFHSETS